MTRYLKGNYTLDVVIDDDQAPDAAGPTEEFEKKALSRLGGSICFVSRKSFLWTGELRDGAGAPDRRPA